MSQQTISQVKKSGATYYRYSDRAVAYSSEISDGVVADFDDRGELRGIEVLTDSVLEQTSIERLAEKARAATRGPKRRQPVAIPEL